MYTSLRPWYQDYFKQKRFRKKTLTLGLSEQRFPYLLRGRKKTITQIEIFIAVNSEVDEPYTDNDLKLSLAQGDNPDRNKKVLSDLTSWKKMLHCKTENENGIEGELGNWTLTLTSTNVEKSINPKGLDDVLLLCHYRFD